MGNFQYLIRSEFYHNVSIYKGGGNFRSEEYCQGILSLIRLMEITFAFLPAIPLSSSSSDIATIF